MPGATGGSLGAGHDDERSLVEKAITGDVVAFQVLYERNVGLVLSFMRSRVGRDDADDLTAETFCRAFEHLGRFEWRGVPFRAWLLSIAHNQVVAEIRRRAGHEVPVGWVAPVLVDSFEEDVVHDAEATALLGSLATLSPAHQAVLDLRFLRDLTVSETAAVLDLGPEAVRSLTYRALKALRAGHTTLSSPSGG